MKKQIGKEFLVKCEGWQGLWSMVINKIDSESRFIWNGKVRKTFAGGEG